MNVAGVFMVGGEVRLSTEPTTNIREQATLVFRTPVPSGKVSDHEQLEVALRIFSSSSKKIEEAFKREISKLLSAKVFKKSDDDDNSTH